MSSLSEGLETTFGSVVDGNIQVIEDAVERLSNDEDFADLVTAVVSSTRVLKSTKSNDLQVVAVAALLLNYNEYKEK